MRQFNSEERQFLKDLEGKLLETLKLEYTSEELYAEVIALTYDLSYDDEFADVPMLLKIRYGVEARGEVVDSWSKEVELYIEENFSVDFICGMFYQHLIETV